MIRLKLGTAFLLERKIMNKNFEMFVRVIAKNGWRNGHLKIIAQKLIDGKQLDRTKDTDLNPVEWQKILEDME